MTVLSTNGLCFNYSLSIFCGDDIAELAWKEIANNVSAWEEIANNIFAKGLFLYILPVLTRLSDYSQMLFVSCYEIPIPHVL